LFWQRSLLRVCAPNHGPVAVAAPASECRGGPRWYPHTFFAPIGL